MTHELLERAKEISNRIEELKGVVGFLEGRRYRRERDMEDFRRRRRPFIPCPKWFGIGRIKDEKVKLDIPIECMPIMDFEIDEECVNLIIEHYKEKVRTLERELEEL